MATMEPMTAAIDDLLLDPNNFRFHGNSDAPEIAERRVAEPSVQDAALRRHDKDGLSDLRASVVENGYLEVDRIVVKPHQLAGEDTGKYLVIEGNRRVATLKRLQQDHLAGAHVPAAVVQVMAAVPCVRLNDSDRATELAIMGVRHVGGIKEWGGYQGAKIVAILKDEEGLDTPEVAARLGLPSQEVNRRYRAIKAVDQMRSDEEYGHHVTPDHYALLHEAVAIPKVRDHYGWDNEENSFADEQKARDLYSLLCPWTDGEGAKRPAKIDSYTEVRSLRELLSNEDARTSLEDPSQTLATAQAIVLQVKERHAWRKRVESAIESINNIPLSDFMTMGHEDIDMIEKLQSNLAAIVQQARLSERNGSSPE
ncbi:ParB N-terminal domain-containing protein [Demequina sp. TTPB684]|uniref:ParB N-terminal domain-containing protein n=1 Tax=unclassified Demequina TaxID=2620311 RepID=UPI001CF16620|nr:MULTISPECIES: ParB N-terminal domain-containing protein [unclassified Demequina]MCB2413469.1 ParB N-terminal domain-containing protein [Demequina sp. TTPB684]UPU88772.1 ParB N-terminal domain-containing protein [Demequina sp. TMPB413]